MCFMYDFIPWAIALWGGVWLIFAVACEGVSVFLKGDLTECGKTEEIIIKKVEKWKRKIKRIFFSGRQT